MPEVQYTPEQLLAQSKQMTALQAEFSAVFTQVTNALKGVNENWSENLARNFSGKIQSAQKSFSSITNMLANGAAAARLGATSHSPTSMESYFSQLIDSGAGLDGAPAGAVGSGRGSAPLSKEDVDAVLDMLPPEARAGLRNAQEAEAWLAKNYNKLPAGARAQLEKVLPSQMKDAISVTHDVLSGEADFSTAGKAVSAVTGNSLLGDVVTASTEAAFNQRLGVFDAAYDEAIQKGSNSFRSGDVGGGILYALEAMGHATRREGYALLDGALNLAGSSLESSKLPGVSGFGTLLHDAL